MEEGRAEKGEVPSGRGDLQDDTLIFPGLGRVCLGVLQTPATFRMTPEDWGRFVEAGGLPSAPT